MPALVLELGHSEHLQLTQFGDTAELERSALAAGYRRFVLDGAVAYVSPGASGDEEAELHLAFMRSFGDFGKKGLAVALEDMEPDARNWIANDIFHRHISAPDIPFTPGFKVTFIPQVRVTLSDGTRTGTVQKSAPMNELAGAALTEWHTEIGQEPAFDRPEQSYPAVLASGETSSYSLRVAGTSDIALSTAAAAELLMKLHDHQVQLENNLYTTYRDLVYSVLDENPSIDIRNHVANGDALSDVPEALRSSLERSIREPDKTGYVGDAIENPDAFLNAATVTDVRYVLYYTYRVPMGNSYSGRRILYYPSIRN